MGNTLADEGAGLGGKIQGNEQKPVDPVHASGRRARRSIAETQIDGKTVKVWLKDNVIHFRIKRRHKVTTLSLTDAYDVSRGQMKFSYAKSY